MILLLKWVASQKDENLLSSWCECKIYDKLQFKDESRGSLVDSSWSKLLINSFAIVTLQLFYKETWAHQKADDDIIQRLEY